MEFIDEPKKVSLNTISKSFAEVYNTCKLKAWKKKRTSETDNGRLLMVGKAAHELFAKKVAERLNEKYVISKVTDPSIILEAKEIVDRLNLDRLIGKGEILGYETQAELLLENGMTLIGIFDLILLQEDELLGPYIQVIDFKTSYIVGNTIDNEAIFYSYLAACQYGLPVNFTRISGRTFSEWGKFFTYEEAISFAEMIAPYAEEIKSVIENEEEPFPQAGEHCINCPRLAECSAREYDDTKIEELVTKQQLFEISAKVYKEKIKNYRIENQTKVVTDQFVIDMKESVSKKIVNKGVKKEDILSLLAANNQLNEIVNSLELKITDKVIEKCAQLGIGFKDQISRSLSITVRNDTGEETVTNEGEDNE